jgi:hypothetical protein
MGKDQISIGVANPRESPEDVMEINVTYLENATRFLHVKYKRGVKISKR